MTDVSLLDLQVSVQDKSAFATLTDYCQISDFQTFLVRDLWRLSNRV